MQMNFFFSHKKYRSIFPISMVEQGLIDFIMSKTVNLIILSANKCKSIVFFEIQNQYIGFFGNVLELVQLKRVTAIK